jgi:hypothetical protein
MRKQFVAAVLAAGLLGGVASTASAADVRVNPFICSAFSGGSTTVPAGSSIVVRQGFSEQTLGILTAFLNDQTTTLSLNGGAPVDLSGAWTEPVQAADGSWVSFVTYPTGITLETGDSLTIAFTISTSHAIPEVFNPAAGGPAGQPLLLLGGGTSTFTCTVTGI